MYDNSNINDFIPSLLNPRGIKINKYNFDQSQISTFSRHSLSLRRNKNKSDYIHNKENIPINKNKTMKQNNKSIANSIIDCDAKKSVENMFIDTLNNESSTVDCNITSNTSIAKCNFSSYVDLDENISISSSKIGQTSQAYLPFVPKKCKNFEIDTRNRSKVSVVQNHNDFMVDCNLVENAKLSSQNSSCYNKNMNLPKCPTKRSAVSVNIQIKKKKEIDKEDITEVLHLNSDAIEKLSNVIVQPPNYKLVKNNSPVCIGGDKTHQNFITDDLDNNSDISDDRTILLDTNSINKSVDSSNDRLQYIQDNVICSEKKMIKSSLVNDCITSGARPGKCKSPRKNDLSPYKNDLSPRPTTCSSIKKNPENLQTKKSMPRTRTTKSMSNSNSRHASPMKQCDITPCYSSHSPSRKRDSTTSNPPIKTVSNRTCSTKSVPHYKIVAGTHFAVDAFSYGDIANVEHYFLTHFHSDHYAGLKKNFSKMLFCSKITGELCVARLGINPKYITYINPDATLKIDGVEITALDANHCPGAIMLVFMLPNGKTILHTGDFRASHEMESYPIFWNSDIHTIYLDTTYCNPRYDFPTQDQSLDMAVHLLRQKKVHIERSGKKFSTVLIVCGTYTIGKEKFFLGLSRRVGCSVWACPEKEQVLRAVEGHSVAQGPPQDCQLHALPMREITIEKLRAYLDSFQGAFAEVVAFKPSGWENGKDLTLEKDQVTIHGIPYSEHSSFSEMIRFVKFLKPKLVVPTVDIAGGVKAVQKHFPCPLLHKENVSQTRLTDYFSVHGHRQQGTAVT